MNWKKINTMQIPTPSFIIDCDILKAKLQVMKQNCDFLGIKPLLSIKGFPLALIYKDIAPYVYGLSAASLFEAQLAMHMGKEIHIHAPAYKPDEMPEIVTQCDHIVFNSFSQWACYKNSINQSAKHPSPGIRINPEYSAVDIEKYNACTQYSRFGVTQKGLANQDITDIDGFHLHIMYDNDAQTLIHIIDVLMDKFGTYLPYLSWINLGGGQRLADNDYSTELLQKSISKLKTQFNLDVYVEPCEAIVTECGFLLSTVLDIVENDKHTAILDTSAVCHMPDVLEMPYCPEIIYPINNESDQYGYILAGISCLAGDIIGEYKFHTPLHIGDKIVFSEMGAYTFAKENYFNGINHPAIVLYCKKI